MSETTIGQDTAPSVGSQVPKVDGGMLRALFDFSFKEFVTPKLIQFVFLAMVVVCALFTLFAIVSAFSVDGTFGILVALTSPLIFLFEIFWARVVLELVIVMFRIYETLRDRPL